mgnify:CR=1 FL=1
METLSEIISRLPRAKGIKGPTQEQQRLTLREKGLLDLLGWWHEESSKTVYIPFHPQDYQQ